MPLLCRNKPVISSIAIGIGVRISVYIQAFVPLIPLVVRVGAGVKFSQNKKLRANACDSIIVLLVTGMALIVSAIIQQHLYGLSVFHALIVLNLCWITVMGSTASYYLLRAVFKDPMPLDPSGYPMPWYPNTMTEAEKKEEEEALILFYKFLAALVAKLMFMGGFGLWVISTIRTFDTLPGACTSSTVYYVLGHLVHVTDRSFCRPMLALSAIITIPVVNMLVPLLLFLLVWIIFAILCRCICPASAPPLHPRRSRSHNDVNASDSPVSITAACSLILIHSIMILSVEKTIRSNNVSSDEQQWSLGQTLAIILALLPLCQTCIQVAGAIFGGDEDDEGGAGKQGRPRRASV